MFQKIRRAALLVRVAALAWATGSAVALAAQATDCVENGGQMECTGPQIVSTSYNMCDEAGTYMYLANIKDRCGWGTLSGDGDIASKAQCYSDAVTGCSGSAVNSPAWSTPGQSYTSWLCWNITTAVQSSIEVLNFARLSGSAVYRDSVTQSCSASGGLPYGIVAMRSRQLGCQDGWTQYAVPGGYQCRRPSQTPPPPPPPAPSTGADNGASCHANGNPIFSGTGNKYQREVDYTGPGRLAFVRHYNSSNGAWTHSYAMRVQPLDATGAMRVLRPDGKEFVFTGSGAGAWASNPTVVERLEQLPAGDSSGALWRLTDAQDTIELYGATGLPLSITYRGGQNLRLQYSNAQLGSVTDDFGRSLSFTADAQGQITSVTAPGGFTTAYAWGANGLLSQVRYPDQTSRQYLYENSSFPKALTGIVDENGVRYASFAYDAQGRAVSTEHAGGAQRYQFSYANSQPVVTEPLGGQRTMQFATVSGRKIYVGQDRPSSIPQDDVNGKQIDPVTGLAIQATDYLGVNTLFTWDATRKLPISTTRAAARPEAQTEQTQWHPVLRLPILVSEAGRSTAYNYDDAGNKLSQTVTDTATGQARTWQWSYTAQGLIKTATDPKGGVWTNDYDASANRISATNPGGQTTRYAWDAAGRITSQTEPNGLLTTYGWDARGRLIQTNRGGEVSTFSYTPSGQLASASQPDGYSVSYSYDAAQRLIAATDNRGATVQYTLDAMGNRVREEVKDASGNIALVTGRVINSLNKVAAIQGSVGQTTALAYDANGEPVSVTDPLNQTTRQALDGLRRPVATTFADNSSASQAWNQLDQLTQVSDPKGVQTTYVTNAFGEVTSETSPDIGTLSYQRDANGEVIAVTDAKGDTRSITRDALGRPVQVSYADQAQEFLSYDTAGNLVGIDDRSGSTRYTRDPQGRVLAKTQIVNDNPANPSPYAVQYGYSAGELARIAYPSGLQVFLRRSAGRVTQIDVQEPPNRSGKATAVQPFASSLAYTALGQPRSWSWSSGDFASRSFDADGRMTQSEIASYSYDAASRITAITQNLWAQRAVTANGKDKGKDKDKEKPEKIDELYQTPISWIAGYDTRSRLTSFIRAGSETRYSYDPNSNRLTGVDSASSDVDLEGLFDADNLTQSAAQAQNLDPASNKLLGFTQTITTLQSGNPVSNATSQVNYALDANGAMTSDGLRTFAYDASGRLSKVEAIRNGEAASIAYLTNALGQRVFKSEPQTEQLTPDEKNLGQGFVGWLRQNFGWLFSPGKGGKPTLGMAYVYDEGGNLLGEYDNGTAGGKGRTEYIWLPTDSGDSIPIGIYRNGKFYAVHADHLGTPRLVTDSSNSPVWQWPYSAFGSNKPTGILTTINTATGTQTRLKATKPPVEVNLRFPGQYFDSESNLSYNYFRSYNGSQGRYTQPDPIGLGGGANRFSYVAGHPLSKVDPRGLDNPGMGPYGPYWTTGVQLCLRPADLAFGLIDHYWINTATKSAGMGGNPNIAPGQEYEGWGQKVQLNDHSNDTATQCTEVKNVDAACVNNKLTIGMPLGRFMPPVNQCQSFAYSVINSCRTGPQSAP